MNRLNTGDTGQAVTSSNDGLLYSGFIGDGMYVLSSGSEFEVEVQSNNLLRMADGSALMQGRHIEIPASDSEYITINNGSQGMNRKDLVVFRYTKDVTSVESVNVVVIEGEETSGTPQAPDYIEGDILTGATLADMPLYVVELQGINITAVTPQFETIGSHKNAVDKIAEHTTAIANLNSKISWTYLGSTQGNASIAIDSKYNNIACYAYLNNSRDYTVPFSLLNSRAEDRIYRQGYYANSNTYGAVAIHNTTSGTWWGWSATQQGTDVLSNTKFFWYAR